MNNETNTELQEDLTFEIRSLELLDERLDIELQKLEKKIDRTKKRKKGIAARKLALTRTLNELATKITQAEEEARKLKEERLGREQMGETTLDDYAAARGLTIVRVKPVHDPFFKEMSEKYPKVKFFSAKSFYDVLARLDESCQPTDDRDVYLIDREGIERRMRRLNSLPEKHFRDLEKARLQLKGERRDSEWRRRLFTFLLKPEYKKVVSPQRRIEMETWLKMEETKPPLK